MKDSTTLISRLSSLLSICLVVISLLAFPFSANATTCDFGSSIGGGQCQGFLTSGTSWSVPADWSSTNTIGLIGGGAGGNAGVGPGSASGGAGGGGGEYRIVTNYTGYASGNTITYQIGQGGAGGAASGNLGAAGTATFIDNSAGSANVAQANGAPAPATFTGGAGGTGGSGGTGHAGGAGGTTY